MDRTESTFTVIGFYPDTGQRYAQSVQAETAELAEHATPEEVHVCGVVTGDVVMVDTYDYVRMGGE